jgi:hypothetical protein
MCVAILITHRPGTCSGAQLEVQLLTHPASEIAWALNHLLGAGIKSRCTVGVVVFDMVRYTAARYPEWQDRVVQELKAAGLTGGGVGATDPSQGASVAAQPLRQ